MNEFLEKLLYWACRIVWVTCFVLAMYNFLLVSIIILFTDGTMFQWLQVARIVLFSFWCYVFAEFEDVFA